MNLARLLLRGSVLSVGDQLLRALVALFLTPLMLSKLGVDRFGVWVIITGFFSQYILLDLGLNASLPHFFASVHGPNDQEKSRQVASTAAMMVGWVALAGVVLTVFVWLGLPLLVRAPDLLIASRSVILILGLSTSIHIFSKVSVVDLKSRLRNDIVSTVGMARVAVCSLLAWYVLVRVTDKDAGIVGLAWVHGGGAVVEGLMLVFCNRPLLSRIHPTWSNVEIRRAIRNYAGWSYAVTTSERLRAALDPFLLGWLLNSAATGVYALGMRPAAMFYDVAYAFIGSQLLPAFSRMQASGDRALLERTFFIGSRISALIAALGGGWLIMLGPTFLRWWVPEQAGAALPVMWCLIGPFMLYAAQIPSIHLLYSYSAHRRLALVFMAGVVGNLALSAMFIKLFGMVGAAAGTAVEMTVVYGFLLPCLVARTASLSLQQVFFRILLLPLLRGLLIISPVGIVAALIPSNWPSIVLLTLGFALWFVMSIAMGFAGAEEKAWILRLGKSWNGVPLA